MTRWLLRIEMMERGRWFLLSLPLLVPLQRAPWPQRYPFLVAWSLLLGLYAWRFEPSGLARDAFVLSQGVTRRSVVTARVTADALVMLALVIALLPWVDCADPTCMTPLAQVAGVFTGSVAFSYALAAATTTWARRTFGRHSLLVPGVLGAIAFGIAWPVGVLTSRLLAATEPDGAWALAGAVAVTGCALASFVFVRHRETLLDDEGEVARARRETRPTVSTPWTAAHAAPSLHRRRRRSPAVALAWLGFRQVLSSSLGVFALLLPGFMLWSGAARPGRGAVQTTTGMVMNGFILAASCYVVLLVLWGMNGFDGSRGREKWRAHTLAFLLSTPLGRARIFGVQRLVLVACVGLAVATGGALWFGLASLLDPRDTIDPFALLVRSAVAVSLAAILVAQTGLLFSEDRGTGVREPGWRRRIPGLLLLAFVLIPTMLAAIAPGLGGVPEALRQSALAPPILAVLTAAVIVTSGYLDWRAFRRCDVR